MLVQSVKVLQTNLLCLVNFGAEQSVKVLQTNLLCLVYVGAECEGASDPGREETAE